MQNATDRARKRCPVEDIHVQLSVVLIENYQGGVKNVPKVELYFTCMVAINQLEEL